MEREGRETLAPWICELKIIIVVRKNIYVRTSLEQRYVNLRLIEVKLI